MEKVPSTSARQQRQEERREHLSMEHTVFRGEVVLPQDPLSTRGIRAIRQVYRRPGMSGTEMQPPSQCQRLVLL